MGVEQPDLGADAAVLGAARVRAADVDRGGAAEAGEGCGALRRSRLAGDHWFRFASSASTASGSIDSVLRPVRVLRLRVRVRLRLPVRPRASASLAASARARVVRSSPSSWRRAVGDRVAAVAPRTGSLPVAICTKTIPRAARSRSARARRRGCAAAPPAGAARAGAVARCALAFVFFEVGSISI